MLAKGSEKTGQRISRHDLLRCEGGTGGGDVEMNALQCWWCSDRRRFTVGSQCGKGPPGVSDSAGKLKSSAPTAAGNALLELSERAGLSLDARLEPGTEIYQILPQDTHAPERSQTGSSCCNIANLSLTNFHLCPLPACSSAPRPKTAPDRAHR